MGKTDVKKILAKNLKYFMQRPGSEYRNPNALAVACGMSPNSVRNILKPEKRPVTTDRGEGEGYPSVFTLQLLADKLSCEVWELLHPDIERSMSEREMYRRIEQDYLDRIKAS